MKSKKRINNDEQAPGRKNYLYEILFVILALTTVFTGLSLFSYNDADPSYSNIVFSRYEESVHNIFGKAGAYVADWLGTIFGWCALFLPFALIYLLAQLVKLLRGRISRVRAAGAVFAAVMLLLSLSVLSGLIGNMDPFFKNKAAGGLFGVAGATIISSILGKIGGIILAIVMTVLCALGIARISFTDLAGRIAGKVDDIKNRYNGIPDTKEPEPEEEKPAIIERIKTFFSEKKNVIVQFIEQKKAARRAKEEAEFAEWEASLDAKKPNTVTELESELETESENDTFAQKIEPIETGTVPPPLIVPPFQPEQGNNIEISDIDESDISEYDFALQEGEEFLTVEKLEQILEEQERMGQSGELTVTPPVVKEYEQKIPPAGNIRNVVAGKDYNIPFSLLDEPDNSVTPATPEELREKADMLLNKLRDFGVDGRIREIRPGPVVTLFELEPAPGIKINKIANLENDLALAMSALSIRIIAPIPGKAAVGIEISNQSRSTVSLKELLEAKEFRQDDSPLAVALGKDISGRPYFTDLRKMPHLLVAGTTGSGKSVCVNSIICSVLYKSAPDMVKFVMIDPKMVELSVYEGIPHLAAPVVTDPRKANAVLQNVVKEMEARYTLLASCKVRSMDSYNNYIQSNPLNPEGLPYMPMPYMLVIVDEFADLMMVAGKEVENSIIRIAQMARAVGIHLVLATQRPSVNVITGIIKANMPARISFKVSSKIDSRTILDQNGAELLLGKGDSLFIPPGSSDTLRIHGCFVSEKEVLRIVEDLKRYGEPEYDMALLEDHSENGKAEDDSEIDSRYEEALKIVREKGFASISMIQRYLKIGYNRAARIVETMERQGLIAPSDGTSKPRELLKK